MAFNNTPAAVHFDEYLTSFAQDYYVSQNYLADRVFSTVGVQKQSDKYYVFDAAEENREFEGLVKKATPLVGPNMFELTQSDDSYFCELYDAGWYIDTFTAANEDEVLRTRQRKVRTLIDNMAKFRDRAFISTFMKTGVWGEDLQGVTGTPSTGEFVKWSDDASTPLDDVQKWKEDFEIRNYGLKPNKITISKDIRRHLLSNTQILGRINGGATIASPALVNDSIIASIFDVDEIIWADAVSNQGNHGATENAARMVSNQMLMVHSMNDAGIDGASAGKIFTWNQVEGYDYGITVSSFSNEEMLFENVAEKGKAGMAYDMKVTGANLGTYVYDIV